METVSAYSLFCQEVDKYPAYNREQNTEDLIEYHKTGDIKLRNKIFNHNLRLVLNAASRYIKHPHLNDIIQEGSFGLIRAIEKFDPDKNLALSTYAHRWIKVFIINYINKNKKIVKFGTTLLERKCFDKIAKYISTMELSGQAVADIDIATMFNVTIEDAQAARTLAAFRAFSLSNNFDDQEDKDLDLPDPTEPALDLLSEYENNCNLRNRIDHFLENEVYERDAEIFKSYVLADKDERPTMEELGKVHKVKKQRIDQICQEVTKRFKYRLKEFL